MTRIVMNLCGAVLLTAGLLAAGPGFRPAPYTLDQLADADFLREEIDRLSQLRPALAEAVTQASDLARAARTADLARLDRWLTALGAVADHGPDPRRPDTAPHLRLLRGLPAHSLPTRPEPPPPPPPDIVEANTPGLVAPNPVDTPSIPLPPELSETGREGVLKLRCVVGTDGRVQAVEILEGLSPELDARVTAAIQESWRFEPARLEGRPVTARFPVAIPIRIRPAPRPGAETDGD